jgi:hypothetical protein
MNTTELIEQVQKRFTRYLSENYQVLTDAFLESGMDEDDAKLHASQAIGQMCSRSLEALPAVPEKMLERRFLKEDEVVRDGDAFIFQDCTEPVSDDCIGRTVLELKEQDVFPNAWHIARWE